MRRLLCLLLGHDWRGHVGEYEGEKYAYRVCWRCDRTRPL